MPGDLSILLKYHHCKSRNGITARLEKKCRRSAALLSPVKVLVFLDRLTYKSAWGAGLGFQYDPQRPNATLRMDSQKQSQK